MKTITCPTCQLVNWGTAESCKRCGAAFASPGEAGQPDQPLSEQTRPISPPFSDAARPYSPSRNTGYNHQGRSQFSQPPKQRLAVFSLVMGILAMPPFSTIGLAIMIGFFAAIFGAAGIIVAAIGFLLFLPSGLVTGIVSVVRANKRPSEYGGKGFAIAGMILSGFSILFIPIIAAIAIPNLLAARRSANEGAAISTLRKIRDLQSDHMAENQGKCGDISRLEWVKDPNNPTLNTKSGYHFVLTHSPSEGCEVHAKPLVTDGVTQTGTRSFSTSSFEGWEIVATDQSGQKKLIEESDYRPQRADKRTSGPKAF